MHGAMEKPRESAEQSTLNSGTCRYHCRLTDTNATLRKVLNSGILQILLRYLHRLLLLCILKVRRELREIGPDRFGTDDQLSKKMRAKRWLLKTNYL